MGTKKLALILSASVPVVLLGIWICFRLVDHGQWWAERTPFAGELWVWARSEWPNDDGKYAAMGRIADDESRFPTERMQAIARDSGESTADRILALDVIQDRLGPYAPQLASVIRNMAVEEGMEFPLQHQVMRQAASLDGADLRRVIEHHLERDPVHWGTLARHADPAEHWDLLMIMWDHPGRDRGLTMNMAYTMFEGIREGDQRCRDFIDANRAEFDQKQLTSLEHSALHPGPQQPYWPVSGSNGELAPVAP